MPARVAGATTAVRRPRAVLHRGGVVMRERFRVTPRCGGAEPHPEDALRVRAMRRLAAERLRFCQLEALADDVPLILSELLTNALLHSGSTEIGLSLTVENGVLTIVVRDGRPGIASPKVANDEDESGRGLLLIESLVQETGGTWGTRDAGAETWCSLEVPAEEQQ